MNEIKCPKCESSKTNRVKSYNEEANECTKCGFLFNKTVNVPKEPDLRCPACKGNDIYTHGRGSYCNSCYHVFNVPKEPEVKCWKCGGNKLEKGSDTLENTKGKWYCRNCDTWTLDKNWTSDKTPEIKCPECGGEKADLLFDSKERKLSRCRHCGGEHYLSSSEKTVDVPLDLSDEILLALTRMAHEQDITLNELMNNILRSEMDKEEKSLDDISAYGDNLFEQFCKEEGFDNSNSDEHNLKSIIACYPAWLERKLYSKSNLNDEEFYKQVSNLASIAKSWWGKYPHHCEGNLYIADFVLAEIKKRREI